MASTAQQQRASREFIQTMNLRFPPLNTNPEKIARDTRNSQRRNELQYLRELKQISNDLL